MLFNLANQKDVSNAVQFLLSDAARSITGGCFGSMRDNISERETTSSVSIVCPAAFAE